MSLKRLAIAVLVADFNGDQKPDIAVLNQLGGGVTILLNASAAAGSVSFSSSSIALGPGVAPTGFALGDFEILQ